jgi:outer membrane protein TolC
VQQLPGGGSLSGGYGIVADTEIDSGSEVVRAWSLLFSQPLLRGRGKNSEQHYRVTLRSIDSTISATQRQSQLAATLSSVRRGWWELYRSSRALTIASLRVATLQQEFAGSVLRAKLGAASAYDTLEARAGLLRARAQLLSDSLAFYQAQSALEQLVGTALDSRIIPDSIEIDFMSLPTAARLQQQIEAYDPNLAIFAATQQRLRHEQHYRKNQLLPRLSVGAGYSATDADGAATGFADNAVVSLLLQWELPLRSALGSVQRSAIALERNSLHTSHYRLALQLQIQELLRRWRTQRSRLTVAEVSYSTAVALYQKAKTAFDQGALDLLRYQNARNEMIAGSYALLQQQAGMKEIEIIMDEMTGAIFNRFGVQLK